MEIIERYTLNEGDFQPYEENYNGSGAENIFYIVEKPNFIKQTNEKQLIVGGENHNEFYTKTFFVKNCSDKLNLEGNPIVIEDMKQGIIDYGCVITDKFEILKKEEILTEIGMFEPDDNDMFETDCLTDEIDYILDIIKNIKHGDTTKLNKEERDLLLKEISQNSEVYDQLRRYLLDNWGYDWMYSNIKHSDITFKLQQSTRKG